MRRGPGVWVMTDQQENRATLFRRMTAPLPAAGWDVRRHHSDIISPLFGSIDNRYFLFARFNKDRHADGETVMKQQVFVPFEDHLADRKSLVEVLRIIPFTHDLPVWHWRLTGQGEPEQRVKRMQASE